MTLANRVRANLRYFLEAKGLTYSDLGFDKRYVGHVLMGDKGFSAARIQEFADRLHVDVSELAKEPR